MNFITLGLGIHTVVAILALLIQVVCGGAIAHLSIRLWKRHANKYRHAEFIGRMLYPMAAATACWNESTFHFSKNRSKQLGYKTLIVYCNFKSLADKVGYYLIHFLFWEVRILANAFLFLLASMKRKSLENIQEREICRRIESFGQLPPSTIAKT